jgi:hypothetical protein
VLVWARFSTFFQGVSATLMPFQFSEQISDLSTAFDFLRAIQGIDIHAMSAHLRPFLFKVQQLGSISVTSEAFDAAIRQLDLLKDHLQTAWQDASNDASVVLPPNIFVSICRIEFLLHFSRRFVRLRERIQKVDSILAADPPFSLKIPEEPEQLRRFLEVTLRVLLLEYRTLFNLHDDPRTESSKPVELVYKMLAVIAQSQELILRELWNQFAALPFIFPHVVDRHTEAILIDKLGQAVRGHVARNTAALQKYEELERTFGALAKESSAPGSFQILSHCLLLVLEIQSVSANFHVGAAVDAIVEKFVRRLVLTKFQSDQRRMKKLLVLTFKQNITSDPILSYLQGIRSSMQSLLKFGWFSRDQPFIANFCNYLNLMIELRQAGVTERPLFEAFPAPSVLRKFVQISDTMVASYRNYEIAGRYEDSMVFRPDYEKGVSLIEIQGNAGICTRELWKGNVAQTVLRGM